MKGLRDEFFGAQTNAFLGIFKISITGYDDNGYIRAEILYDATGHQWLCIFPGARGFIYPQQYQRYNRGGQKCRVREWTCPNSYCLPKTHGNWDYRPLYLPQRYEYNIDCPACQPWPYARVYASHPTISPDRPLHPGHSLEGRTAAITPGM